MVLEDDTKQLEEVVVVGYGQQKKASVVGAITQTTGKYWNGRLVFLILVRR